MVFLRLFFEKIKVMKIWGYTFKLFAKTSPFIPLSW